MMVKPLALNHLVTKLARHQLLKKTARPFPPFGTMASLQQWSQ
jgi:hypothetical protein